MKNAISEKYRKYLIKLHFDKGKYFIVWGTDMTSENENDFILTDQNNKILCFSESKLIPNFLSTRNYLMTDISNFKNWVNKFSFSTPYTSYRILTLKSNEIQDLFLTKNRFNLVENLNLIKDFAVQTNNQKLIRLRKNKSIKKVWNEIYNVDFWNKKTNLSISDAQLASFTENYNKMIDEFVQNIIVITPADADL